MSKPSIAIHLPDGSVREVPQGTTPLEIANSISPRLAAASVVARITPLNIATEAHASAARGRGRHVRGRGHLRRRASSISPRRSHADARLELVTENDPDALKVVRHSAAHVIATAVLELFPETKLGHGPATDSGFFYDFYRANALHPR